MVCRIDWNYELALLGGHEWICQHWFLGVYLRCEPSSEDLLLASGAGLFSIMTKPPILQEGNKPFLLGIVLEDREIDLGDSQNESVVEDDLEKSFPKLEPIR